jgi:2-polyprenyl-3-methyl-5-hydroxy-6-metoxy-1,4-benzoquinol methylase
MQYFVRSAKSFAVNARRACPDCGSQRTSLVRRKMFVTELRRCENCELQFRAPVDPPDVDERFYQSEYRSGFTTDCPSDADLKRWQLNDFRDIGKDFSERINLLRALGIAPERSRVLDFGCSWGYGTWQLAKAGFEVTGSEISKARARFGREKLQLNIVESLEELRRDFDVFFSAHVIEHLSRPRIAVEAARRLLRPGGFFVSFTPNGCGDCMQHNPASFHRSWGRVHPSYMDERYWFRAFHDCKCLVVASPYDLVDISNWTQKENCRLTLNGSELLFVAKFPE